MTNLFSKLLNKRKFILMAEIKLKSPSGILGKMNEIEKIAKEYEMGGADVLSVVTSKKYFGGNLKMIVRIKKTVDLPIFCKDFIRDEKQLEEIKNSGASAVLLLSYLATREKLKSLYKYSERLKLTPVVEVDNKKNLREAIEDNFKVIAVNSRNLRDFSVDREKAIRLLKKIPNNIISLAFSGVRNRQDLGKYLNSGAKGVLVGKTLMRSNNRAECIKKLREF